MSREPQTETAASEPPSPNRTPTARRWLCVHCDERFDHSGEQPVRCPRCLRRHGLEPVEGATRPRRAWLVPTAIGLIVAAAGLGWWLWSRQAPPSVSGEAPLRPLTRAELDGYLRAAGVQAPEAIDLFVADAAVERLARSAGEGDPVRKARALVEAIQQRARARAFVVWSTSSPRPTPPRTAAATAALLERDGGRERLYPLEVAAAAVAALRVAGVDAMLAEVYAFEGDRAPPDPSGHLGYFAVAVPAAGRHVVLDPWAGRSSSPRPDDVRVLDDVRAIAAALVHHALYALVHEGALERAFDLVERARRLDRGSPTVRSARGAVLLVAGGAPEGRAELEAAAQLRPDGPRRNNLAGLYLVEGDLERAEREVRAALAVHPDHAGSHATAAAIHMAQGEREQAGAALDRASRLDPDLPQLPLLRANFHLVEGEMDLAVQHALDAIERRPNDWQQRLAAARILRAAGRYGPMREQARRVLELVPASRRADVERLIRQMLGPTALESDDEAQDETASTDPAAQDTTHQASGAASTGAELRLGSKLLGEPGGLPPARDGSRIRLRGSDEGLRLDLRGE
ncbi:MAG: tetratricopeptide repeat protein [Myxococcota bacterium]|nr:tetratricopeptide repeat protein [Myxococcota bacterium]MDW8363475.1 tetratricopeptide repeat protein [Myxococcales bacterium]